MIMNEKKTPLIDKKLLDLLVCPITGEQLKQEGDKLVGKSYSYEIRDGVPIMYSENGQKANSDSEQ